MKRLGEGDRSSALDPPGAEERRGAWDRIRALSRVSLGREHPDPRVRAALAREYVHREYPRSYAWQVVDLLTMVLGAVLHLPAVVALGVLRFCLDGGSRVLMRRFTTALDAGQPLDPLIRRGMPWYLLNGLTWAALSWPTLLLPSEHPQLQVLIVIALVAQVILATSTCFVPALYRAGYIGFVLSLLGIGAYTGGMHGLIILVSTPPLLLLMWDLARTTRRRHAEMLVAQMERDLAISTQATVIDQLGTAREHATRLATTDTVTQLPNRQAFLDHLDRLMERDVPFTLVLVDLDYFKNVNDTMGHHVGDAVLVSTAATLLEAESDASLIARLGGDELALVLPKTAPAHLQERFDLWSSRLAHLQVAGVGTLGSSVTAGSAHYPEDGCDRRAILNAADMALRVAKAALRGSHQSFRPEMTGAFNRETRIANLLVQSITGRMFDVHVQPQVRMDDGEIVAGEILTRFRLPELASFPVQLVFDVAEERGLGRRLSDVLLESARDAVIEASTSVGRVVPLSINLSPATLKLPDMLLHRLAGWVTAGLDPRLVTLEITEDAISGRGLGHVGATLKAISALGFGLALDDFGTGHASLAHLHKLPIDELKIPKQFVDTVTEDRKDQAIVRSALALCEHLEIRCVVEGVETRAQRDTLLDLGASVAQGHLWSTPRPLDDFISLLRSHHRDQMSYSRPAGS